MLLPIKSLRESPQISPRERNSSSLTSSGSKRGEQRFPRPDKETLYCNLRNSAVHVLFCGNRFLYRLQPRTRPCPGFILLLFLFLSLSQLKYRQIEKRWPISREVEKFIIASGADNWSRIPSCFSSICFPKLCYIYFSFPLLVVIS